MRPSLAFAVLLLLAGPSGAGERAGKKSAPAPKDSADAAAVFINGRRLGANQLSELATAFGGAPPPGRYWYDARSGFWGHWGRESAGLAVPGQSLGPLAPKASAGDTGVFLNGRELNLIEARYFNQLLGGLPPGRWWVDARGNLGAEGSPAPLANVQQAARAPAAQGGNTWRNGTGFGGSDGTCSYVNIPGSGSVMTGCD